jgi:antirestriction protein
MDVDTEIIFENFEVDHDLQSGYGEALYYYCNNLHIDVDSVDSDVLNGFLEAYVGVFSSLIDYANEYVDGVGFFDTIPYSERGFYAKYFDYESFVNDLIKGGEIWFEEVGNDIFIYRNL